MQALDERSPSLSRGTSSICASGSGQKTASSSKVLALLDRHMDNSEHTPTQHEENSSFEVVGPVCLVKSDGLQKQKRENTPTFSNDCVAPGDGTTEDNPPSSSTHWQPTAKRMKRFATLDSAPAVTRQNLTKPPSRSKSHGAIEISLPIYAYRNFLPKATVVYTRHEEEANDLVQTLKGPLGFDMEWRVIFRAHATERRTALVQVCDERIILLVQLSAMKRFPEKLKDLIENKEVIKLGANIHNDGQKLFRDFGIRAAGLVELGAVALRADPKYCFFARSGSTDAIVTRGSSSPKRTIVALAAVVAKYAERELVKGKERTGNWEGELNSAMIEYAANDAHCALTVYKNLLSMAKENGRVLTPLQYATQIQSGGKDSVYTLAAPVPAAKPSSSSAPAPIDSVAGRPKQRPQHLRAYSLWHFRKTPLNEMCSTLRSQDNPLKESTVISYVVEALKTDPKLSFSMARLQELIQMEAGSWRWHKEWILAAEAEGRGS